LTNPGRRGSKGCRAVTQHQQSKSNRAILRLGFRAPRWRGRGFPYSTCTDMEIPTRRTTEVKEIQLLTASSVMSAALDSFEISIAVRPARALRQRFGRGQSAPPSHQHRRQPPASAPPRPAHWPAGPVNGAADWPWIYFQTLPSTPSAANLVSASRKAIAARPAAVCFLSLTQLHASALLLHTTQPDPWQRGSGRARFV
jgi:hypothetical protein